MASDPDTSLSKTEEVKNILQSLLETTEDDQTEENILQLIEQYDGLESLSRNDVLCHIAAQHGSDISDNLVKEVPLCDTSELPYNLVFSNIAKNERGVRFLVDLRADLLASLKQQDESKKTMLQQLSLTLKTILSDLFNVDSLVLVRVTLDSPKLLERVGALEAVHPVRDQADLEARVGKYRRCFVLTHPSMLREPLVIFHVALTQEIAGSLNDVTLKDVDKLSESEVPEKVQAAMFYSISSTQPGLAGLRLASVMIEKSVSSLRTEFPDLQVFSTLSPIPGFRSWLLEALRKATKSKNEVFNAEEARMIEASLGRGDPNLLLLNYLNNLSNLSDEIEALEDLKPILLRLAARYLCLEKKGYSALNPVANFHLNNGATIWRINWMADVSFKGIDASLGLMVNYRYFLDRWDNWILLRKFLPMRLLEGNYRHNGCSQSCRLKIFRSSQTILIVFF